MKHYFVTLILLLVSAISNADSGATNNNRATIPLVWQASNAKCETVKSYLMRIAWSVSAPVGQATCTANNTLTAVVGLATRRDPMNFYFPSRWTGYQDRTVIEELENFTYAFINQVVLDLKDFDLDLSINDGYGSEESSNSYTHFRIYRLNVW